MRTQGKITHWNDEKGYGFITPSAGAKQVFFHNNAFCGRGLRPALDQRVTFVPSTDDQGRPCAVRVALAGDPVAREIKRNDRVLMIGGAGCFLLIVALSVVAGAQPPVLLGFYLAASALAFLVYAMDKSAAASGAQRIRELHLHLLALIGGWPGAMVAQQVLRHKSVKAEFRAVFWVTVVINLAAFLWLFTESGAAALRRVLLI
jgi:uncharacterized membrane protein YsdA (DUF1294 family)/cold shock CspA family protein